MILLSLLCVIALQYYRPSWSMTLRPWRAYRDWLVSHASSFVEQSKLTRAVVLVVPLWLAAVIVLSIVQAIFGTVSSFVLDVFIAWTVIDVRPFFSKEDVSIKQLLIDAVFGVFAPVFWFALLGWPALLLYLILRRCHQTDQELAHCDESVEVVERARNQPVSLLLGLLAWIPERLAMLSCAVVGNFSVIVKFVQHFFSGGISLGIKVLAECFCPGADTEQPATAEHRRTLLYILALWLIVMVVFFLGVLLG